LVRLHAVQKLCSSDKGYTEAGKRQQNAAIARVILHIVDAALDRPDGDCIGHQIRFEACLDREESGEALQHIHSLSKRWANGGVPPLPA
jgi:hypothetical protein